MTEEAKERLFGDRVRALATVVLTRFEGLTIFETKAETGLDFHVTIGREEKPMRLVFGVLLRGISSPATSEQANKVLGPTMGQFQGMRKFTYPVCLFVFTTREEKAFFSWLAEPVIHDGGPKLVHRSTPNCVELTDEWMEHVLEQIVSWYDAVEPVLIA